MRQTSIFLIIMICLLLALSMHAYGGQYEIGWSTIDGGGGTSAGGTFALTGTIGQPDTAYSAGGSYELLGGFWPSSPLCIVDFHHFAKFADWWLEEDCDLWNWCGGADLDHNHDVDIEDLRMFSDVWLYSCPPDWPLK